LNPKWPGPAIPPGEILLEEYLKPLGLGHVDAARRLGASLNRSNEIMLGKRRIAGHGDSARAPAEDVSATLDAAAGRLGPARGPCSARRGGRREDELMSWRLEAVKHLSSLADLAGSKVS
jgi:hypothetical protein